MYEDTSYFAFFKLIVMRHSFKKYKGTDLEEQHSIGRAGFAGAGTLPYGRDVFDGRLSKPATLAR